MRLSIDMEEYTNMKENQIFYHLERIFTIKKELEISKMFTKIAEADCIDDLKLDQSFNKS